MVAVDSIYVDGLASAQMLIFYSYFFSELMCKTHARMLSPKLSSSYSFEGFDD